MLNTQARQMIQNCIALCQQCHNICVETIGYYLRMGSQMSDWHPDPGHVGLLANCAEICQTSANFMLRGSTRACAVCAEVCDACAQSCEQFPDDAQMRACADACRRCAESCRQMASMPG